MIDLHIHTNCSDGREFPEAMVQYAIELGLDALGITDHDTIAAIAPAEAGANGTIRIVRGIELSATEGDTPIHLLGYGIDPNHVTLNAVLTDVVADRRNRAERIVAELNDMGLDVTLDMVEDESGDAPITRAHIGYALLNNGYVRNTGEAFARYLSNDAPAFFPQTALDIKTAIATIHDAGGIAVYAHPGITKRDELIARMVREGLDGIETIHPQHTRTTIRFYERLARKHGLIATGGSDAHGRMRMAEIATSTPIPHDMLRVIDEAIAQRRTATCGTLAASTPSVS
ncbi:MAG TPA: PHP domain-containing protein [Firmicutes bacterium]|nr:PHP domain-containing protein [Bacillota bacterium]